MKHHRANSFILGAAIFAFSSGLIAIQRSSGQDKPAQKGEMKSMGDMSMGGMMKGGSK